jgi:predicted dehydrogenase
LQNPDLGGGALLDLGIYPVSFAWDILGAPSEIVARSVPTATGVDGRTSIILSYASGAQAVLHTSLDAAGPNRAAIVGTKGWIDIDGVFYNPTDFRVFATDGTLIEEWHDTVTSRGMQYQAWEIENRIAGAAPTVLPIDETVAIMGTLDEVRRQIGLRYPTE